MLHILLTFIHLKWISLKATEQLNTYKLHNGNFRREYCMKYESYTAGWKTDILSYVCLGNM